MDNFAQQLRQGDPVKVMGRVGNFRFIAYYNEKSAVVVGPIGKNGENEKIVSLRLLKRPSSEVTRQTVAPDALAVQISSTAHANAKRRNAHR